MREILYLRDVSSIITIVHFKFNHNSAVQNVRPNFFAKTIKKNADIADKTYRQILMAMDCNFSSMEA